MSTYKKTKRWLEKRFQKLRLPKLFTFGFYWSLLAFPFKWLFNCWQKQRLRDLVMGIPAIAGLIFISILVGKARLAESSLSQEYFNEAQQAIAQKHHPRAQMLLSRVLNRKDTRLSDAQFSLAVLLDETGQKHRASELFRILAPDDRRGNRAAHRRLAMILAEQSSVESNPLEVKRL